MSFTFLNDQGSTQTSSALQITPGSRVGILVTQGATNAGSGYYPTVYLQVSLDGTTWATQGGSGEVNLGGGGSSFSGSFYVFSDVAAYLRIRMQQDNAQGRKLTVQGVEAASASFPSSMNVDVTSLPDRITTDA